MLQMPTPYIIRIVLAIFSLAIVISTIIMETTDVEDRIERIEVSDIRKHNGFGSIYKIPEKLPNNLFFHTPPDTNANLSSTLKLELNGEVISKPHALHADIKDYGDGRLSHWGDAIIFSMPQNAKIPANAQLSYRVTPAPTLFLKILRALSAVYLIIFLIQFKRMVSKSGSVKISHIFNDLNRAMKQDFVWYTYLTIVGLLFFVSWFYLLGGFVLFSNDSNTYFKFNSIVPPGYPLFITAIREVAGYVAIPIVQIALLTLSITWFCTCVRKVFNYQIVIYLMPILLFSYFPQFLYAGYVLSEALSVTLMYVLLGVLLLCFHEYKRTGLQGNLKYIYWAGFLIGCLLFIRPAFIFMLAIIPAFMFFFNLKKGFLIAASGFIPVILVLVFSTIISTIVSSTSNNKSQSARTLSGHVSLLYHPDYSDFNPEYEEEIYNALKPYRDRFEQETTSFSKFIASMNSFNSRILTLDKKFKSIASRENLTADERVEFANKLRWSIAFSTLKGDPGGYARYVYINYTSAWRGGIILPNRLTPGQRLESFTTAPVYDYSARVATMLSPRPSNEIITYPTHKLNTVYVKILDEMHEKFSILSWPRTIIAYLASVAAVIFLVSFPFLVSRMSAVAITLAFTALIIQAGLIFTTMITAAIPRYGIPFEILLIIQFGLLFDFSLKLLVDTIQSLGKNRRLG